MDREAWSAVVNGVTKSQTWLSWTEYIYIYDYFKLLISSFQIQFNNPMFSSTFPRIAFLDIEFYISLFCVFLNYLSQIQMTLYCFCLLTCCTNFVHAWLIPLLCFYLYCIFALTSELFSFSNFYVFSCVFFCCCCSPFTFIVKELLWCWTERVLIYKQRSSFASL